MGYLIRFGSSTLRNSRTPLNPEADTDTSITFNYRVDGDTLVYSTCSFGYASLDVPSLPHWILWTAPINPPQILGSMYKTSSGKASLRIMHTQSGQSLYDKTWTESSNRTCVLVD